MIILMVVMFWNLGLSSQQGEILSEEEMSKLVGKGETWAYCWSYGCQPEFPGVNNCPEWTGPGLDTEHICDYCTGEKDRTGKFCKETRALRVLCVVWGADYLCGQKQKGECKDRFDEETNRYLSHCEAVGTETYGMCVWGWQYCHYWHVPD